MKIRVTIEMDSDFADIGNIFKVLNAIKKIKPEVVKVRLDKIIN